MKNGIEVGASFYYTGDMANVGGRFRIREIDGARIILVQITPPGCTEPEEPRTMVIPRFVLESDLKRGPGRRFIPWAEHAAERRAGLEQLAQGIKADPARIAAMLAEFDRNHALT